MLVLFWFFFVFFLIKTLEKTCIKENFNQTFCNKPAQNCELWEAKCIAHSSWPRNHCTEMIQGELMLFVSDSSVWDDQKLL